MYQNRLNCYSNAFKLIFLLFVWFIAGLRASDPPSSDFEIAHEKFSAVRFDPSYYYNTGMEVKDLANHLVDKWLENSINVIYMKVYDPVHGAVYPTEHPLNIETDYGRLDLLRHILDAGHKKGLKVFGWIPAFNHKQAWDAHLEWRVKKPDGGVYRPDQNDYFLCVRSSQFRAWWLQLIQEILDNYPDIDGIDIAEPIITWRSHEGCFCDVCREAYGRKGLSLSRRLTDEAAIVRAEPLSTLLFEIGKLIHAYKKEYSITTIATPHSDGSMFTPEEQRALSGFDIDTILDSYEKPDILNVELIFQQWADLMSDTVTFNPAWTKTATREIVKQMRGRTRLVVHPELTPFRNERMDRDFLASIKFAMDGGAWGIDFYDSHQADVLSLWPQIQDVLQYVPEKSVTVYYDPEGENDARQVEVLLRHFNTRTELIPVESQFTSNQIRNSDILFYLGVLYRESLPGEFLRFLHQSPATICWLNYNINYLGQERLRNLGLQYEDLDESSKYTIYYKETPFSKIDSTMNIVTVQDSRKSRIIAESQTESDTIPYVIRSGEFWYIADLPTAFVHEGGRHIVFADLLHDILREDHAENHRALVRIEDVNPLSDAGALRAIGKFLGSRKIPFSVGLTPLYLDPATNSAISLSEQPELVKALRYMVSKGGTIVLHGFTHQYRGQTTDDYEYWDELNDTTLFQDSEEYVRDRINRGVQECIQNRLYPMAWETPHYAASLLDYQVIDEHFKTVYERRQTANILGTDQLLPFFIPAVGGRAQMVPENLGYIPLSNPIPDPMIASARNNLAVRDGFASFFFHPFVDIKVLKSLIKDIKKLGYTFSDIRTLDNHIKLPSLAIRSRSGEVEVDLRDQYLEEFYITPKGKVRRRTVSDSVTTQSMKKTVDLKPSWLYVARGVSAYKASLLGNIGSPLIKVPRFVRRLWHRPDLETQNRPVVPIILLDENAEGRLAVDQMNHLHAFDGAGIDSRSEIVDKFLEIPESVNLLVIPQAAASKLTEQQELFIIRALSKGLNLVLEGESNLCERIGIGSIGDVKGVSSVRDQYYPQVDIHWKEPGSYRNFEIDIEYVTYFSEVNTDDAIVVGGEYGEGNYLYFASLFDPTTEKGYGRFPYYLDLLQRQFQLWPLIRRDQAEIYFEPGDREDVSIEDLIKMWKQHGFRRIYVAGWHVYPDWTYEYDRLIELAHQNAMLVYLWLEFPHVNEKFWIDHPEWREQTATGKDATGEWRRLMALTDMDCRNAVISELRDLILRLDWDGVNLAELYFESPLGPKRPDLFTPMHSSVRESFQQQSGFDPVDLFDASSSRYWENNTRDWVKFQEYRRGLIFDLHEKFLAVLYQLNEEKGNDMEIVVTSLENLLSGDTGDHTATDTHRLLTLQADYPFTLQIEDPQKLWHEGPSRYEELSEIYNELISEGELILDINVVPYRSFEKSMAPTRQPTGLELLQYLISILGDDNRLALYAESGIYAVDLPWIAYAMGNKTRETLSPNRWKVEAQNTVAFNLDPKKHKNIYVNGNTWPAYHKGRVLLPPGSHEIQSVSLKDDIMRTFQTDTRLVDISGELESCRTVSRGLEIVYDSRLRNFLTINEWPLEVYLDGEIYNTDVHQGIPGFTIKLPPGRHRVRIHTRTRGAVTISNFSMFASLSIVALSFLSVTALVFLYGARSRRRRRRRNHNTSS